jgi:AcrR family transcriptional regulator
MMPRTEADNQRLREARRAQILESARKVFARNGLATSMADVAAAADISQGLVYRYFASKEALFRALIEEAVQGNPPFMLERPEKSEKSATAGERLTMLISRLVEARREQPEFFQLFNQVLSAAQPEDDLAKMVRMRGQVFVDTVRQLIVEGQATGEFIAGDPDQLVMAVVACLEGLTSLALIEPEHFKKHCPDAEVILRMLKPPST